MNIKRDILWRVYLAFMVICLLAFAILFKAARIQMVEGKYWRSMADSLTIAYLPIDAERGNILAEDGSLLATSIQLYEIGFDVNAAGLSKDTFNRYIDSLSWCLANYFQENTSEYYYKKFITARGNGKQYVLVKKKINYLQLQEVKKFPIFRKGRNKGGFIITPESKRQNPFRLLASRTIGFVRDSVASVGIEGSFDSILAGTKGKRLMQRLSNNIWIPVNEEEEFTSIHGKDIVTTIDIELQDVLEHSLMAALDTHKADHGCAVLMEVKTGKIKAIANLGKNKEGAYTEQYNYAIGEATEPGSTFKLMSALALMEDGYANMNTLVDIEKGTRKFYDRTMHDSESHDMNLVSLKKCFEKSSNVGFAKLIDEHYQHNPDKFLSRIHQVGLDNVLGFEINGEAKPFIKKRTNKTWSGVSLPWMAVGYELTMTPLQILAFYNAVANNGTLVKPFIVEKIQQNGVTLDSFGTTIIKQKICSDGTIKQLRLMMESVVEEGTANNVKNPYYRIAGKTGTSKIYDKASGLGYNQKTAYQASFCGYFPAENPRYSCVVVISSPSAGLYYGSKVAAPVFKEVADKIYATSFDIHTQKNTSKSTASTNYVTQYIKGNTADLKSIASVINIKTKNAKDEEWCELKKKGTTPETFPVTISEKFIPDVIGMGLKDAIFLLENKGLRVKCVGKGIVIKQSINAGQNIEKGKEIIIELG